MSEPERTYSIAVRVRRTTGDIEWLKPIYMTGGMCHEIP